MHLTSFGRIHQKRTKIRDQRRLLIDGGEEERERRSREIRLINVLQSTQWATHVDDVGKGIYSRGCQRQLAFSFWNFTMGNNSLVVSQTSSNIIGPIWAMDPCCSARYACETPIRSAWLSPLHLGFTTSHHHDMCISPTGCGLWLAVLRGKYLDRGM